MILAIDEGTTGVTALVIDADGLNALQGCFPEDLPQRRWPTILTPPHCCSGHAC